MAKRKAKDPVRTARIEIIPPGFMLISFRGKPFNRPGEWDVMIDYLKYDLEAVLVTSHGVPRWAITPEKYQQLKEYLSGFDIVEREDEL